MNGRRIRRLVVISAMLFTGCLFILSAHMEAFAQDSEEIRQLDALYMIAGLQRPSIIYPASGATIRYFIDRSELRDHLPSEMKQILDDIALNLGGDNIMFTKGDLGANLEIPLALTIQGFIPKPEELSFLRSDGSLFDRLPLISLDLNIAMTDHVFGQFRLDISKRPGTYHESLETNLILSSGIIQNLPHAAYISIGTKNINLIAGRKRISAGRGKTGNMALGDNFLYRDFVKLSLHAFPLSYELLFNSFDPEIDSNCKFGWADSGVFHPQIIIHRISASLFPKMTLTLYEGLLSWSNSGMFDPKLPTHSWFFMICSLSLMETSTTSLDWRQIFHCHADYHFTLKASSISCSSERKSETLPIRPRRNLMPSGFLLRCNGQGSTGKA